MQLTYSIKEAAAAAGLGLTRFYEAVNKGDIRVKKYGRRSLVLREDLQDFLDRLPNYEPRKAGG